MKKVLSIVLAIAMIATMSVVAFAADTGSANAESATAAGSSTAEVKGTYATGTRTDMYKVDVAWGALTYTYTEAAEVWNVETHTWDLQTEDAVGVWAATVAGTSDKVTVTNHSSKDVTVSLAFADDVEDDGTISGTWSVSSIALDACAEQGTPDTDSATLTISGKYLDEDASAAKIGTVTATIA